MADNYDKVKLLLYNLDRAVNHESAHKIMQKLDKVRDSFVDKVSDTREKYVPYPQISNPNFYDIILKKREFSDNAYDKIKVKSVDAFNTLSNERCSLKSFDLTPNQTFIRNFLSKKTPYNGVLLYHGVGVGKTCTSINIVEHFLENNNGRKVYILMPSTLLKDNFRKQIYDSSKPDDLQCVASKYTSLIPNSHMFSQEIVEKRINKIITSRYKFLGLLEFANDIKRMAKDLNVEDNDMDTSIKLHKRIQIEFSNSIFVIDEVHNIRLNSELTSKRVPPILQLVLKHARNIKLVLMTATPMFNDPKEIVYIINLLLFNDKRPPVKISNIFDADGKIKSIDFLTDILKGYVSYMKGDNPFTFPFKLYPSVNNDPLLLTQAAIPTIDMKGVDISNPIDLNNIELIGSKFMKSQKNIYKQSEKKFSITDEDDNTNFSLHVCIQLSNIVYPVSNTYNDCFGENGFMGCFNKVNGKGFSVKYKDNFVDMLAYDNISKISCKMKTILEYISKSTGIVFIYSNWKWSGVLPLAIALEHEGYTKYNSSNILQNGKKKSNVGNYVILSGDSSISPDNDGEIRVLKNENNRYGQDIKIVLATSVATEGVDLKCVREVHIMEPWYHMNKLEQIIGRAVRTCSHVTLPPNERNVTVYHHVATVSDDRETIDTRLYRISLDKQKKINMVENIMKNVAVDCNLNKNANIITRDDIDVDLDITTSQGSSTKYRLVENANEIRCISSMPSHKLQDTTTFDITFHNNISSKYEKHVKQFFHGNAVGSYDDIHDYIQQNVKKVVSGVLNIVLSKLIVSKNTFRNAKNEYGYIKYLSDKYIFIKLGSNPYLSLSRRLNKRHNRQDYVTISGQINRNDVNIDVLDANVKAFCEEMKIDSTQFNEIHPHIVDYVVDRMSMDAYLNLCLLTWDTPNSQFMQSLARGQMLIKQKNVVKFVACPFDGESKFYTRGAGVMRPISELEMKENKVLFDNVVIEKRDYVTYLLVASDGSTKFKILQPDKDSLGFVCQQTSTLKVKDLRVMIDNINPSYLAAFKKMPDKKKLCDFYELMMRVSEKFARPHIFNLLFGKKKKPKKMK